MKIAIKIHSKNIEILLYMAYIYVRSYSLHCSYVCQYMRNIYYNVFVSDDDYFHTIAIDGVETTLHIWYVVYVHKCT